MATASAPPGAKALRAQLEALRDAKERQLHCAGMFGQRIVEQQMELDERISLLRGLIDDGASSDESDSDSERKAHNEGKAGARARNGAEGKELGSEARERWRELRTTLDQWDRENALLSEELTSAGGKVRSAGMHLH
jgi:hypothetical protein